MTPVESHDLVIGIQDRVPAFVQGGGVKRSLGERFWSKVQRRSEGECWPWLGAAHPNGRGHMLADGKVTTAARVSFYLENGRWPVVACHSCDNPNCVNPSHIWDGTYAENTQDCRRKGRHHFAARTHCPHGHEYTPENTRSYRGSRKCRACDRAWHRHTKERAHHPESEAGREIGPGEDNILRGKFARLKVAG